MKLASEFVQLPLQFDVERLQLELAQFDGFEWEPHPFDFPGNSAIPLVSARGEINNDFVGDMRSTAALERCPYIQQVLAQFNTVLGRSRLMRLEAGAKVPPHSDTNYAWRKRVRIHIPIITSPEVLFTSCGSSTVHMQAGQAWIFDNWRRHTVENNSAAPRVHLVIDTAGSSEFWAMVSRGSDPTTVSSTPIEFKADEKPELLFETYNSLRLATPGELENLCAEFLAELELVEAPQPGQLASVRQTLSEFQFDWRMSWLQHADSDIGVAKCDFLRSETRVTLQSQLGECTLASNGAKAYEVIENWLSACIDRKAPGILVNTPALAASPDKVDTSLFERPVFIVAAPRSGSTMLFEALAQNMELWTIGDESHAEFESIRALHPASHRFESNALSEADATSGVVTELFETFTRRLRNAQGALLTRMPSEARPPSIRFLEKTPKNALRIPFLKAMFPTAVFIFLHREPRPNIAAIINAWKSGNFVTYPNLPQWSGPPWSLLLPESWRQLQGAQLPEIAAHQWRETNIKIIRDLEDLPAGDYCAVSYEALVANRESELKRLCGFIGVPFGPRMQQVASEALPLSKYTLTPPAPEKWRQYESEIEAVMPKLNDTVESLESFLKL